LAHSAEPDRALEQAERVLDAFYAWDAAELAKHLDAGGDAARMLYYQAWAEAAHYQVARRQPCVRIDPAFVECAVTVTDDFGRALGYTATDTFRFAAGGEGIEGVRFDGDDPPVFDELFAWIAETRPAVLAGPCKDAFAGGTTPAACARAVADAAKSFAAERGIGGG
jgi:hypothetical protein